MTSTATLFERHFSCSPSVVASAPGRVNLIGDHTDYNEGLVLPTPLELRTEIAISLQPTGRLQAVSATNGNTADRALDDDPTGDWTDYILGCLSVLDVKVDGLYAAVTSDVPMGASVSSSAALEVATLRALNTAMKLSLTDDEIARLGQRCENEFVGVQCGLMDQMVSSVGKPGHALLFDTQSGATENIPLFADHKFVTIHSGQSRQLVDGAYNERRQSCEAAAAALGIPSLRHVHSDDLDALAGLALKRARHVCSETERVAAAADALKAGDPATFGKLMTASHWSLSRDFETSTPEVDRLIGTLLDGGAAGVRITGAGFGGCVVALLPAGAVGNVEALLKTDHPDAWIVAAS